MFGFEPQEHGLTSLHNGVLDGCLNPCHIISKLWEFGDEFEWEMTLFTMFKLTN